MDSTTSTYHNSRYKVWSYSGYFMARRPGAWRKLQQNSRISLDSIWVMANVFSPPDFLCFWKEFVLFVLSRLSGWFYLLACRWTHLWLLESFVCFQVIMLPLSSGRVHKLLSDTAMWKALAEGHVEGTTQVTWREGLLSSTLSSTTAIPLDTPQSSWSPALTPTPAPSLRKHFYQSQWKCQCYFIAWLDTSKCF